VHDRLDRLRARSRDARPAEHVQLRSAPMSVAEIKTMGAPRADAAPAFLELKNVSKHYASPTGTTEVLNDVNLRIAEGEFVAIVGFSGSGKTTLISTMAGLIRPDRGEVLLEGKPVTDAGPERGVVFQSYSLMPWLSVYGNVALAVDAVFPTWSRERRDEHTQKYIAMVGLAHATDRRPAELSGGMRQRVAVARALAMDPRVLLLDEPLSALDALTRAKLQDEIEAIWREQRKTVVLVTNDVDEALLLADRIIPLKPGPRATLGRQFIVDLPRPRDRTKVNHDARYQELRGEITQYLISLGTERSQAAQEELAAPQVVPITASKASRHATVTKPAEDPSRFVELYDVTKIYPTPKSPLTVVDNFNLNIRKGEFISLIGHSGCGKS